jgi:hypothetical protein
VLIITREAPARFRGWGLGGSLPPAAREGLDWLTFGRLMGWPVSTASPFAQEILQALSPSHRQLIIACDPEEVSETAVRVLEAACLEASMLLLVRVTSRDAPLARLAAARPAARSAAGTTLDWTGPGPRTTWRLRTPLSATALEEATGSEIWATLGGAPIVAARPIGKSRVLTLGGHPSVWRDADGVATAFLRHLLIRGAPGPVAWVDLHGTVILRMDDPGGAQNVHFQKWYYRKLGEQEWREIGLQLAQHSARLSVGYTPGWVDDGDSDRGRLEIGGTSVARIPGAVHPSPLVRYVDLAGHAPGTVHDYEAEFRGIQTLRDAGLGEVELHGYTHMYPDTAMWAAAEDRYITKGWFRELGTHAAPAISVRPRAAHPINLGVAAIREQFGVQPTAVICPGHQCDESVIEQALDEGLVFAGHDILAIRDRDRWCWIPQIGAPELDEVDAAWLTSGFPVVAFFHDRDLVLEGTSWLGRYLKRWRAAGAVRFVDFRQLAAEIGRRLEVEEDGQGHIRLIVHSHDALPLVGPFHIRLYSGTGGTGQLPTHVRVVHGNEETVVSVRRVDAEIGCVTLSPGANAVQSEALVSSLDSGT